MIVKPSQSVGALTYATNSPNAATSVSSLNNNP